MEMTKIIEKYNLVFTRDDDTTTVSSISPLLSYYINNSALTQATELYNGLKYIIQYYKSAERDVIITKTFLVKIIAEEVNIIYKDPENPLKFPETIFALPVDDMLYILQSWIGFLTPLKVRDVEIKNGQGVIDIISDHFASALIIEKAVAVIWPDCAGSIGEYYAVSRENYDKQRELTANLIQSLTYGSDQEALAAVTVFLDLFANGTYNLTIGAVDVFSAETVYDSRITYADGVDENEMFTYNLYHYGYGEVILFSRSINTIDQNRVKEYIEIINNGSRPKIILFSNSIQEHSYVLDGHHKLLAYQKLGINAPVVIIKKTQSSEKAYKNIVPQLLDILKPVEARHILQENSSISEPEIYLLPSVTHYLDDILTNEKCIGITLHQLLYKTYHSTDKDVKTWTDERLLVLSGNKYKGNGQFLYYTDKEKTYHYKRVYIEDDADFRQWENLYLENGRHPAYLEEREKELTKKYYPPHRPTENKPTEVETTISQIPTYTGGNPWTWQFVARMMLIIISFLGILRGCR